MNRVHFAPMKHLVTMAVSLAFLAVGLAARPAAAAPGGGGGLLGKVQGFYETTTDFKASFRQVVQTRTPKRTFTRSGTVFFKKPGMMRWDYKVPDEVYYVSDGEVLWSFDVEDGVAFRLRVKDSELFHALGFLTGTASLASVFDATEGQPTASGLVPLKLVPRRSEGSYRSVTLFVDPRTGEVRETEVEDPVGNLSRVTFESPSFKALPADGFRFKPPEGVRVQDLGGK